MKTVQNDVKPHEANLYMQGLRSITKIKELLSGKEITIEDAFFENYAADFGALYEKLPKQLIHGNPTVETIIYENGEAVGIKGYENYNVSHIRLFDIIWCAGEINLQKPDAYLKMLKEILFGYNSISPLTEDEKQAVYYILCTNAMTCAAYCGEELDVTKRNLNALAFLAENRKRFSNLI